MRKKSLFIVTVACFYHNINDALKYSQPNCKVRWQIFLVNQTLILDFIGSLQGVGFLTTKWRYSLPCNRKSWVCLHSKQWVLWEIFTDEEYLTLETASCSSFQAVLKPVQHTVSLDAHSVDKFKLITIWTAILSTITLNNHIQWCTLYLEETRARKILNVKKTINVP